MKFTIKILMALPASGKSFETKKQLNKFQNNNSFLKYEPMTPFQVNYKMKKNKMPIKGSYTDIIAFNVDKFWQLEKPGNENFLKYITEEINIFSEDTYLHTEKSNVLLIFDGLFTELSEITKFLEHFNKLSKQNNDEYEIELNYWKPDYKKIYHNNSMRLRDAEGSIKFFENGTFIFEYPTEEFIKEQSNIYSSKIIIKSKEHKIKYAPVMSKQQQEQFLKSKQHIKNKEYEKVDENSGNDIHYLQIF